MKLHAPPLLACFLAALILAARVFCPNWSAMAFWEEIIFFLCGLMVGVRLPDLDFFLPGLSHRSGVTHSCLPAMLLMSSGLQPAVAGLALGIALHLSSDMQPRAWTGGALIKFPLLGSIGMLSPLWLVANVVACLAIVMDVLASEPVNARQIIILLCLTGSCWYFWREEKRPLLPLMVLGFACLLVHAVRGGSLSVQLVWQCLT